MTKPLPHLSTPSACKLSVARWTINLWNHRKYGRHHRRVGINH